jgi:hypothetical protein
MLIEQPRVEAPMSGFCKVLVNDEVHNATSTCDAHLDTPLHQLEIQIMYRSIDSEIVRVYLGKKSINRR